MDKRLDKRHLLACIAALAIMLGFDLAISLSGRALDLPTDTGWGTVPIAGLLVTALAMAVGGWIARRGFRPLAVLLAAALWLSVVSVIGLGALSAEDGPAFGLGDVLSQYALAMVLSLLAAWLGAVLGERVAAQRFEPAAMAQG
ncbi:hypothetical protein [Marilutibacter chinensis]|uniref:Major facilitator superfamily (MFS) profile domain-containing protein n=1 Tax=Marilutibacter chinensis TaxID=2912247 RepID=A0ABS9HWU0_9GAMM|nr:hypothetical protein [Lysobacter chinensis]MCF7222810.1 hypothetical protein [Lysobacter chinensis]